MRQAANNLAFGGGVPPAAGKKPKKQVTVPKSPNFSKMFGSVITVVAEGKQRS